MTEDLLRPNEIVVGGQDRYKNLNLIGRGGMGAVYRVQRASDHMILALKEMRPPQNLTTEEIQGNRELFEQEVRLLRGLKHPNIPVITDYFEYEGRPTMVMEYIDGQTLEDLLINEKKSLSEHQIVSYGIQLCRVLHYLHNQTPPIIYRDLKPPNIMLTTSGVLKLVDFGVARTHKGQKRQDTIAMGSAGYAPPEQYGKAETDARSDIYALGATLYHLATGIPPVPLTQVNPGDIRKHMVSMKAKTEKVIIKAMWLKREGRFADCAEMEAALMKCLDTPYVDPTESVNQPKPIDANGGQQQSPSPPTDPEAITADAPEPDTAVSIPCSKCNYANKVDARFCSNCGMPLGSPPTPRLLIKSPRGTWEMKVDRLPFRIGRRDPRQHHYPELDLAEHDRGIASRHHAMIQLTNEAYTLTDQGSTNGTMLNDIRLPAHAPQKLKPGDRIRIGEVNMEFRWT